VRASKSGRGAQGWERGGDGGHRDSVGGIGALLVRCSACPLDAHASATANKPLALAGTGCSAAVEQATAAQVLPGDVAGGHCVAVPPGLPLTTSP